MNELREVLAHTVYQLEPPNRKRTRPMQVLALGLSRSGTDSLRAALLELGYDHTYHGWDTLVQPEDHVVWHELAIKKFEGHRTGSSASDPAITRADFEKVLGNCVAVTDMPAVAFAPELIAAYTEAKVILNVRRDVDSWYKSTVETFIPWQNGLLARIPCWFCAELFWPDISFVNRSRGLFSTYYRGSFVKNGKWVMRDHNATVRGLVPKDNLLEWSVEDGWGPLCKFLGKEAPGTEFPSGNMRGGFAARVEKGRNAWQARAQRNMFLTAALVCVIVGFLVKQFWSSGRK